MIFIFLSNNRKRYYLAEYGERGNFKIMEKEFDNYEIVCFYIKSEKAIVGKEPYLMRFLLK